MWNKKINERRIAHLQQHPWYNGVELHVEMIGC